MNADHFDRVVRACAPGSRRRVFTGVFGLLVAMLPGLSTAKHTHGKRPKDRQQARRAKQDKRAEDSSKDPADDISSEGCASVGAACATDTGCCSGTCEQHGACTRKKKKGKKKKKKTVLTGACRCVDTSCVPDNDAACSGKQCGNATNNCGTTVSCGSCPSGQTCQSGTCHASSPPAQPSGLEAESLDSSRIRLTWHDVSGESGYRIHNGDELVATLGANTTTYTVTGLAPNTYRCHHVQAFNNAGDSPWTDWACTTTHGTCQPDCTGRECGDDSCGSTCGTCSGGQTCEDGTCMSVCPPEEPITCDIGGCCPETLPQCCPPSGESAVATCAATEDHCCSAENGGGSCSPALPTCCPSTQQAPGGSCAEQSGTCCPSGAFSQVCPAAFPQCCPMATQDGPLGHCTEATATCCTTGQGGGSCQAGFICCPLTAVDTARRCVEAGGTCCPPETGGGKCPALAPKCCPVSLGLGCCPQNADCCVLSEDCAVPGQTCDPATGCCTGPGAAAQSAVNEKFKQFRMSNDGSTGIDGESSQRSSTKQRGDREKQRSRKHHSHRGR